MKATHYIKEVKKSQAYKDFIAEDPEAYLCSLFFIRDFNENHNETQVDFYSPKKKAMISFKLDKGVQRVPFNKKVETLTHKKFTPKPLNENTKVDVDELKAILVDEMHNRGMTYEIEKILAFLNIADDETVWNCTAFLKGLGLLQSHIEDESASVLFMEKKSLFDLVKFAGSNLPMKPADGEGVLDKVPDNVKILNQADIAAALSQGEKKEVKEEKEERKTKSGKAKAAGKISKAGK